MNVKPGADDLPVALDAAGRALITLRVIPRAPRTANDALLDYFALILGCPRRQLTIASGAKSRDKRIAVEGLSARVVRASLAARM